MKRNNTPKNFERNNVITELTFEHYDLIKQLCLSRDREYIWKTYHESKCNVLTVLFSGYFEKYTVSIIESYDETTDSGRGWALSLNHSGALLDILEKKTTSISGIETGEHTKINSLCDKNEALETINRKLETLRNLDFIDITPAKEKHQPEP